MVRFGLSSLPFPILLEGLMAGFLARFEKARFLQPDGSITAQPRAWWKVLRDGIFPPHARQLPLASLGKVIQWQAGAGNLEVVTEDGRLRFDFLTPGLLRIRATRGKTFPALFSYAVVETDWPGAQTSWNESEEQLTFASDILLVRVEKADGRFAIFRSGQCLLQEARPLTWEGEACTAQFSSRPDGEMYGLGEKAAGLGRKGKSWTLWNRDPQTYDLGDEPLYSSIPFWLEMQQGKACGFFLDSTFRATFDFGSSDRTMDRIAVDGGEFRLYVLSEPTFPGVLAQYASLTGHMPLPPLWSLGYHQSRWSYETAEEVRRVARELRQRRIPCDAIHLDIDYMDGWRCFTWDRHRFPDPAGLIAELRTQGFHAVPVVDPGIKAEKGYPIDDEGVRLGMFCTLPDGTVYRRPAWPGWCHFPDFTNPPVREWWGSLYRGLLDDGVTGVENDMNEPADLAGSQPPPFLRHAREGKLSDHRECHNIYGMQMARATYEGLQRLRPDDRPFLITRSTFAGGQRYGATWTADNQSSFTHLRLSLAMILSLGLSGFPFAGCDIGGFAGSCSGELLTRWTQLGSFFPFFRNHCAKGYPHQEPWVFGEPFESACRKAIELRYQLLPYLYAAFDQAHRQGLPIVRPLFFEWPEDDRTRDESEFLCGDSLLVAPIMEEGAVAREAYLPAGRWFAYEGGQAMEGNNAQRVGAAIDHIPLFVKAGAVIPCWPAQQFVGDPLPGEMRFRVYAGSGESLLYEDDGLTPDYQRGAFRRTRIQQRLENRSLRICWQAEGAYPSPSSRWVFTFFGLENAPRLILEDARTVEEWSFSNGSLSLATTPCATLEIHW
jgi:alpha-glucosidase